MFYREAASAGHVAVGPVEPGRVLPPAGGAGLPGGAGEEPTRDGGTRGRQRPVQSHRQVTQLFSMFN